MTKYLPALKQNWTLVWMEAILWQLTKFRPLSCEASFRHFILAMFEGLSLVGAGVYTSELSWDITTWEGWPYSRSQELSIVPEVSLIFIYVAR